MDCKCISYKIREALMKQFMWSWPTHFIIHITCSMDNNPKITPVIWIQLFYWHFLITPPQSLGLAIFMKSMIHNITTSYEKTNIHIAILQRIRTLYWLIFPKHWSMYCTCHSFLFFCIIKQRWLAHTFIYKW